MRIVLDTNVLVAAFLSPHSHAARILRLILQGRIELVADERIMNEYEEVLARPKFGLPPKEVGIVMETLRNKCIMSPASAEAFNLPDNDDAPFVESAFTSKADCIVTGNKRHFPEACCRKIRILSPAEYIRLLDTE